MALRVLKVIESTMEVTNQRVAVIEVSEIKKIPIGKKSVDIWDSKRVQVVIDYDYGITQDIVESAKREESINLNLNECRKRDEYKDGVLKTIFYHHSVKLLADSVKEQRQWFYDLDFIFQEYLKAIFRINIYENPYFASEFYDCRFELRRLFIYDSQPNFGHYVTKSVVLLNGGVKPVEGNNFEFIFKASVGDTPPEILNVDPMKYTAKEKPQKRPEGTVYVPFLRLKT